MMGAYTALEGARVESTPPPPHPNRKNKTYQNNIKLPIICLCDPSHVACCVFLKVGGERQT